MNNNDHRDDQFMCPSIHIGFHSSIARKHALIEWDLEQQNYSIQSLCPGGIWVDGVLKHTVTAIYICLQPCIVKKNANNASYYTIMLIQDDGPVALRHRSVVQIGYRIFFFLVPVFLFSGVPELTQIHKVCIVHDLLG